MFHLLKAPLDLFNVMFFSSSHPNTCLDTCNIDNGRSSSSLNSSSVTGLCGTIPPFAKYFTVFFPST